MKWLLPENIQDMLPDEAWRIEIDAFKTLRAKN